MDGAAAHTHDDAVAKALQEVLQRRADGEVISDEAIRSRYPGLPDLPAVLEKLKKYGVDEMRLGTPKAGAPGSLFSGVPQIPGYSRMKRISAESQAPVFRAIQDSSGEEVAIKFLRGGPFATAKERARLVREVNILRQLRHPNIVSLYISGEANGHAYFVMEYVDGRLLTDHAGRFRSHTTDELVAFFAQICEGVAEAHNHGITHRDLKPGNILVTPEGTPRVIDFGLARVDDDPQYITQSAELLGTLPFMAPELLKGHPADHRSDVYALGMVFFQMLTSQLPYSMQGGIAEIIDVIRSKEPRRPSHLKAGVDTDLEAIVLRCLAKEPSRRYADADSLLRDLRRYLAREPVEAKPESFVQQLCRLSRRNRLATAGAVTLLCLLLALTVASLALWRQTERRRMESETARLTEVRLRKTADDNARQASLAAEATRRQACRSHLEAAAAAIPRADVREAERSLDAVPEELRGWEWSHLHSRLDDSIGVLKGHTGRVTDLSCSRDGQFLASVSDDCTVRLWGMKTRQEISQLTQARTCGGQVTFLEDGTLACATSSGSLHHWTPSSGEMAVVSIPSEVRLLGWRDHGRVLVISTSKDIQLLDSRSGDVVRRVEFPDKKCSAPLVCLAPDGNQAAWSCHETAIELLDIGSLTTISRLQKHEDEVEAICYGPDGRYVISGSRDTTVRVWDAMTGAEVQTLVGHMHQVRVLAISPNGQRLASAGQDRTIRIWDLADGREVIAFRGHRSAVTALEFLPDGNSLASGAEDGELRIWNTSLNCDPRIMRGHVGYVYDMALSNDGHVLGTAGWDGYHSQAGALRFWDVRTGASIATIGAVGTIFTAVAADRQNLRWVTISTEGNERDSELTLWEGNPPTKVCLTELLTKMPERVAFDSLGQRLAVARGNDLVSVWDTMTWKRIDSGQIHGNTFAFSPTDTVLATANGRDDRQIHLWNVSTVQRVNSFGGDAGVLCRIAFSPDGHQIASASSDGFIHIWDVSSGKQVAALDGHTGGALCIAYSPDGSRLASGGQDGVVRLWNPTTYEQMAQLCGHRSYVYCLAFTPDGRTLFSGSGDFDVRRWDTRGLSRILAVAR